MTKLPKHVADHLRSTADRLAELAEGAFSDAQGGLMWGVPRWVVRAYVWSIYQCSDPVLACMTAHFGREYAAAFIQQPDSHAMRCSLAWTARLQSFKAVAPPATRARAA